MTVVILLALATYRLTRLLVADSFPPIADARARITDRWGVGSWQAYLSECPWCVSMYVGPAVVAIAWGAGASIPVPVASALVCSAAAGLIAMLDR